MSNRKLSLQELGRPSLAQFRAAPKLPVAFVLDDIRSANNVGSLFRTADGFGFQHVYLCGITATPPHRDILKTALGATEAVSWSYHEDCLALVRQLSGGARTQVVGLEQTEGSQKLAHYRFALPEGLEANELAYAVVLGNEVKGVQQAVIDVCEGTVEIEQFGTKHSFNVAGAGGMVGYELSRQLRG